MRSIIKMFALIPEQHGRLIRLIMINLFLGLGVLANPYIFKGVVDELSRAARDHNTGGNILLLIFILGSVRLGLALCGYIQEVMTDIMRSDAHTGLRRKLFKHTLGLSIEYYESHRAGDITQQLSTGVYEFGSWLFDASENITVQIISVVVAAVAIVLKSPMAGIIVLIVIPVHIGLSLRKIHHTKPLRRRGSMLFEASIGQLTEAIQNMTTIRTLGSEQPQYDSYHEISGQLKATRRQQFPIEWRHNAAREVVEALATVSTVGVVAVGATQGRYSPGDILLVALLIQQAISNLRPIARFIDITGDVSTSCQRILDLLAVSPTVVDHKEARNLRAIESIEFDNVSFTYPGQTDPVLNNISFKLNPGQTLALVGPSGTGKTTLIKLILRLYNPTEGNYFINSEPIEKFKANSLRNHMGVVMQDVALFNATFEENLRLARPQASQSELEAAVALAHAKEFVDRLPDGYKTIVGERGIRLSGGQKQRLAIARAILKRPQLVILDEATSALDTVSEREVQAGLNSLLAERMSVIIAHRLSTIRHADVILVIENGRVEEQGDHHQLMKAGGLYAKLYDMQSERLVR